ncbi:MAG: arginine--tRNA ligase, partial [Algoriphagus sp.]
MEIQETINQGIQLAFQNIFNHDLPLDQISLAPTRKEFEGTYTFVVFPYLKISKTTPEATATLIGDYLKENVAEVAGFNVVKGFLNLELNNMIWVDVFQKLYANENIGQLPANGQKVMVEY